jgi:hypothetical protein
MQSTGHANGAHRAYVSGCKAQVAIPTGVFPCNAIGPPATEGLSEFYSSQSRSHSVIISRATPIARLRVYASGLSEMWAVRRPWPRTSATRPAWRSSGTGPTDRCHWLVRCPNLSVIQKIGRLIRG